MSGRWAPTPAERRALLEIRHPAATAVLVLLLLALLAGCAAVAG
jgi:hypothetical protein